MSSEDSKDFSKTSGKWMFFAAWIGLFGLMIAFFSGYLDRQYNPNERPNSVTTSGGTQVVLKQNKYGHYVVNGEINGSRVTFLVDTGATSVSIGAHLANQLNLVPGQAFRAQTANGTVVVAQTNIAQLSIGDISLSNVEANLNPGIRSDEILLGMSVLKQLEITQRGDTLILRTI